MSKICPQCGLENLEETNFCNSCGMAFETAAADISVVRQNSPPTTVVIPVAVKEGIVPVKRQHVAVGLAGISVGFLLMFSVFSALYRFSTAEPPSLLIWGSKGDSFATTPLLLLIVSAIAIFFVPKMLAPKIYGFTFGKAGKARKKYKENVKREFGVDTLYKRSTYLPFVIVSTILALVILATIIVNVFIMRNEVYKLEAGLYISLSLAGLYFLSLQLTWPFKRNQVVKMDVEGKFYN